MNQLLNTLSENDFDSYIKGKARSFIHNANSNLDVHEINLITTIKQIVGDYDTIISSLPIFSLRDFINLHKDRINTFLFIYFIGQEISSIHSYGRYHGDISLDSIGIYYNNQSKIFVPSLILFYFHYKSSKNSDKPPIKIKSSKKSANLEDNQKKDIKSFFKIIEELNGQKEFNFDEIANSKTIDDDFDFDIFLFDLFNYIIKRKDSLFLNYYYKISYQSFKFTKSLVFDMLYSEENNLIKIMFK